MYPLFAFETQTSLYHMVIEKLMAHSLKGEWILYMGPESAVSILTTIRELEDIVSTAEYNNNIIRADVIPRPPSTASRYWQTHTSCGQSVMHLMLWHYGTLSTKLQLLLLLHLLPLHLMAEWKWITLPNSILFVLTLINNHLFKFIPGFIFPAQRPSFFPSFLDSFMFLYFWLYNFYFRCVEFGCWNSLNLTCLVCLSITYHESPGHMS